MVVCGYPPATWACKYRVVGIYLWPRRIYPWPPVNHQQAHQDLHLLSMVQHQFRTRLSPRICRRPHPISTTTITVILHRLIASSCHYPGNRLRTLISPPTTVTPIHLLIFMPEVQIPEVLPKRGLSIWASIPHRICGLTRLPHCE